MECRLGVVLPGDEKSLELLKDLLLLLPMESMASDSPPVDNLTKVKVAHRA